MGRKDSSDLKRRTKKNSAIEKKKRNGNYGQKHIRAQERLKDKRDKK
tara:strand:+ start:3729 stop:3869 length:141 start_codon:yes stop_codon:yes gene_type:complete